MLVECSNCREFKDKKEVYCILGVWVCSDCYPVGYMYSDKNYNDSGKEKLSDFPFAEDINDICRSRLIECGISFNPEYLICKDCLCYDFCLKNNVNNFNNVNNVNKLF